MPTPFHCADPKGFVTTHWPDGRTTVQPFGDFLQAQARHALRLRAAAIDAALDALLQRLRRGLRLQRPLRKGIATR